MVEKQGTLFDARVHRMCFDQENIYTSIAKNISTWDKQTKELISSCVVPPNDNLNKGALLCADENNIYFNSIYFFHVMDKKTNEIIYQKQFGTDNSSDFDLGTILADKKHIYFPMRNNGLVVLDKHDYENVRYLNKDNGSIWALDQDENMIYFGGVDKTYTPSTNQPFRLQPFFPATKAIFIIFTPIRGILFPYPQITRLLFGVKAAAKYHIKLRMPVVLWDAR